ncbi:MAG: helicase [Planctomycetes bacterium]|nr:helicase [Planctomycetota bacterium]
MNYTEFLRQKMDYGSDSGFEPTFMPSFLFDFQSFLTDWAIHKGRAAIFADCGMGKTPMQLVWAQNVVQHTNRPVLILTPLAVTGQTLEEAEKFDIGAQRAIPGTSSPVTIYVTNYEKLHLFNAADYGGIVADESSILKNFNGKRRIEITEFMRAIPYRLLCTATAAPNDWVELGTSSEALGYLGHTDMLSRFFKRQQTYALTDRGGRKEWQLKGHAAKGPFWRWVASWARAARLPSDLGFDDDGFILPSLSEMGTLINATRPAPGMLFDIEAIGFHQEREVIRRTIPERCEMVAEKVNQNGGISMVWCHLNDEGNMLEKLMSGSVQIAGRHSDSKKEEAAYWFCHGTDEERILISKPKIFGFGLNFQHCNHMTYFPDHSYEKYYQATRRLWRFGQEQSVTVDLIYTDGGKRMMDNLARKAQAADRMFDELIRYMNRELHVENVYHKKEIEIPRWMNR